MSGPNSISQINIPHFVCSIIFVIIFCRYSIFSMCVENHNVWVSSSRTSQCLFLIKWSVVEINCRTCLLGIIIIISPFSFVHNASLQQFPLCLQVLHIFFLLLRNRPLCGASVLVSKHWSCFLSLGSSGVRILYSTCSYSTILFSSSVVIGELFWGAIRE